MASKSTLLVARLMWLVPILLLLLAFYQVKVSHDIRETLAAGEPAVAAVTRYTRVDRKDVTQAELDLRVTLADGTVLEREKLALPYSLAFLVERDTLDVLVLLGTGQEIVIRSVAASQSRIAALNAAICFVGFLLFGVAVGLWNRYLRRYGDPSERPAPLPPVTG